MSTRRLTAVQLATAVAALEGGDSQRHVAARLRTSQSVISRAWRRYQVSGSFEYTHGGGRQRSTTVQQDRYLTVRARRNRSNTYRRLADDLFSASSLRISLHTVRRRLIEHGLHRRRPMRFPGVTTQHKVRRCQFSRIYLSWTDEDWGNCLFTDESKFVLHHDSNRARVTRRSGERYNPSLVLPVYPFGRGSITVWGGITSDTRTELVVLRNETMTAQTYLNRVLAPIVRPMAEAIGPEFVLVDDNARPHRARVVNEFLQNQEIRRLDWPACSPDLNPIEHLWDQLQRRISGRNTLPQTLDELQTALLEEWEAIPQDCIKTLVRSMPRRLQAVINARGGPTRY